HDADVLLRDERLVRRLLAVAGEPGAEDLGADADLEVGLADGLLQLAVVGGAAGDEDVEDRRRVDRRLDQPGLLGGDDRLGDRLAGRLELVGDLGRDARQRLLGRGGRLAGLGGVLLGVVLLGVVLGLGVILLGIVLGLGIVLLGVVLGGLGLGG